MSLSDKIEAIRKKPEHIRMRYVWFFVVLSMLFVIVLWIFSLKSYEQENQSNPAENNFFNSNMINNLTQQKETLDEARKNAENSLLNNDFPSSDLQQDAARDNQNPQNLNDEKEQ